MASSSSPAPLPYDMGTSLAGAIIEHPALGFLLQLRDEQAPSYPLHWSLFGGHMEGDEAPDAALWRELAEELQLGLEQVSAWQLVQRNPRPHGGRQYIFHVVTEATTDDLVLGEGKAMRYVAQAQLAEAITSTPASAPVSTPVSVPAAKSLWGHGFAANVVDIFRDHFAGRCDAPDEASGSSSSSSRSNSDSPPRR